MDKIKKLIAEFFSKPGNRRYLKYVLVHKYWVYVFGRQLNLSVWQLLIHDWSKFTRREWRAYRDMFSNEQGWNQGSHVDWKEVPEEVQNPYTAAWLFHIHANPHHWQYWVLINDIEAPIAIRMPDKYFYEMMADWQAAQMALEGKVDLKKWYTKYGHNFTMHPETRKMVEEFIA